jgi:hypothetical protein
MKLNVDDLIEKGLVNKKNYTSGIYTGLSVLKYTKQVFWKNLWHLDERLLECRGTVVDEEDNVVVLPFKKVFNLGELPYTLDPEMEVIIPEKVNGFMAAATMTKKYGLIISTTGTLDSEYAVLAKKWIDRGNVELFDFGYTYLFEICDNSDPHIVKEGEGAYLIGLRDTMYGSLTTENTLDSRAKKLNYKRPSVVKVKFKDIPTTEKEGFMVIDATTGGVLCKLKSPFYLAKKALMRMGKKRCSLMFNNTQEFRKQIDEEFYNLLDFILATYSEQDYNDLTETQRRNLFEEYFNDNS